MTADRDSLGGFNVNDFFKAIQDKGGFIQALAPDAPVPLLPAPEPDTAFEVRLRTFQLNYLIGYFNGKTMTDIRNDALAFKNTFERNKSENHSPAEKQLFESTTLQSLAELAKEQHERFARKSGAAIPKSEEEAVF
ncbi:MAG TPA: hypothetical protein VLE91_03885 [Candidatus Saccharimonadales bacterium]|nr:hypothetical protein [Candidatus Saccharimonadales bacterium]